MTSPAVAAPAVVIDEFGCGGFVPNPDTPSGFPAQAFLVTTQSHAVKSGSGNQVITCHFDHSVALARASGATGFLCGTAFGLTNDSRMIATPGGKATLVCRVNAENQGNRKRLSPVQGCRSWQPRSGAEH